MRLALFVVAVSLASGPVSVGLCATTVDYKEDVEPILQANCFGCHGEKKGLGRLRLHTTDAIREALDVHDDLLTAGKPDESELYARLVLPANDKKLMPKGGDPLSKENIATIKKWIEEGGVFEITADAPMDEAPAEKPKLPERPELGPASPDAIRAVQNTGALVIPLYAGANELRVSFPSSRDQVTDETVALLVPLAGQLVELDLSGTKITDASADSLKQLVNLDTLHLEKTSIGDAAVAALAELKYLNYLNLHSTKVTDAALESLKPVVSLQRLYVWQTPATYDAAKALEESTPGLEVNLGWNHPGVVRERINSELARVEQQQKESGDAMAEAEKALATAKKDKEAADKRAAELKRKLESLDEPAEKKLEEANQLEREQPADEGNAA